MAVEQGAEAAKRCAISLLAQLKKACGGDLSRVQFSRVPWGRTLEGKTLRDWAARQGVPPTPEQGARLVLEAMERGGGNAIYHVLDEGDVRRIMQSPFTMVASDGRLSRPGELHPHPRAYGTFPRVLGEYVRAQQVLALDFRLDLFALGAMAAQWLGTVDWSAEPRAVRDPSGSS